MEKNEIKIYKSYKSSLRHNNNLCRYKWNISENEMDKIDHEIIDLVPKEAKILEVGSGDGRLAEKLMNKREDITFYHGIDIVEESLIDARNRNIRDVKIYRANYWDILSEDGEWNFVISQGVLFSCTNPEYKGLLMDLLDNTSDKGFIVLSVISLKPRVAMLEKSLENSVNVSEYYLKGPRKRFNFPENLYNHPFWIIREGIKNKNVPIIPDILKGLPKEWTREDLDCIFK